MLLQVQQHFSVTNPMKGEHVKLEILFIQDQIFIWYYIIKEKHKILVQRCFSPKCAAANGKSREFVIYDEAIRPAAPVGSRPVDFGLPKATDASLAEYFHHSYNNLIIAQLKLIWYRSR